MEENVNMAGMRPEFCSHSARVMSFKSKKTLPKASRWPHPPLFPLTAEVLASAGYFHDPADNEPDRTTCWMCGESMKGWAEDDDPWELHLTWSPKCSFARIALLEHQRDTKKPSWSDLPGHSWGPTQEWFPRGSTLIEARLATFCGSDGPWKHEGKNGIPTRLELARAGFHFTPNLFKKGRKFDVDDTTSCCYCHRSVTEWEVDDDPVSVHLKKGACIFFTATQPAENPKKANVKPKKKPSKAPDSGPSNSTKDLNADSSIVVMDNVSVVIEKSSRSKKKPSSTASSAPKTGKRVLASSTSGTFTAANESLVDLEDSIQHKPSQASRKVQAPSDALPSPEPVPEQIMSKPPVALAKSTRLSRSTTKIATAPTSSNRSTSSNPANRLRTRASSNASSTMEDPARLTLNQTWDDQSQPPTEDEEQVPKPKKPTRPKKTTKLSQPTSVVGSKTEDNCPVRQTNLNESQQQMLVTSETIVNGEDSKVVEEEIITTKKTRLPGKKKTQLSQSLRSEAPTPALIDPPANKQLLKSLGINSPGRSKGLLPSLFPGFNAQAPQLYPSLLPIAAKMPSGSTSEQVKSPLAADPVSKGGELVPADMDNLLEKYLSQESKPIPEGWLANPYNPSRPFPPLTNEEKSMPLSQYFAYRAHQEEQAFLEWVEMYQLKPWLDSVEKGRLIVQNLVEIRLSSSNSIGKLALGSHDQSSGHKENFKVFNHL
ncbi:hypothetical protein H4Q26_001732 [Puccinia striiformis f. sp. tritici PST-130]|nr:hypothetical protein H4Q26_001732 [Puccinia striiformis f. sp. tritici PST-130]